MQRLGPEDWLQELRTSFAEQQTGNPLIVYGLYHRLRQGSWAVIVEVYWRNALTGEQGVIASVKRDDLVSVLSLLLAELTELRKGVDGVERKGAASAARLPGHATDQRTAAG